MTALLLYIPFTTLPLYKYTFTRGPRLYYHQIHGYPMNIDYKFEFFKNLHEQVR